MQQTRCIVCIASADVDAQRSSCGSEFTVLHIWTIGPNCSVNWLVVMPAGGSRWQRW